MTDIKNYILRKSGERFDLYIVETLYARETMRQNIRTERNLTVMRVTMSVFWVLRHIATFCYVLYAGKKKRYL